MRKVLIIAISAVLLISALLLTEELLSSGSKEKLLMSTSEEENVTWLHLTSNFIIWATYVVIPVILGIFLYKKKDSNLPFRNIQLLFLLIILFCGLSYLVDAVALWQPVYRLSAVVRFVIAIISLGTVLALIKVAPHAMKFKTAAELEELMRIRTKDLQLANYKLAKEIREKEAARKESRMLLQSLPLIAWVADAQGNSTYVNDRWEEYCGEDAGNWYNIVHPDDKKIGSDHWRKCLITGEDYEIEQRLLSKDGHYEWFLVRAVPIKDENDKIVKWIGTNTNIDDQKRNEIRKDTFINIASHELKTPLTSIKAYIELLGEILNDHRYEPVPTYLKKASRSTQKLSNLITELLDVSRIQSGKLSLIKSSFNLDEMINDIVEVYAHEVLSHRVIFNGGLDFDIEGDKNRLEQVITNLLSNAVKYSPKADEIRVETSYDNGWAKLSVTDQGIGISLEDQGKLFEQFYRTLNAAKNANGLGMGLYIVKEIVNQHQGKVKIKSAEGEGTTVTVLLPVDQPMVKNKNSQVHVIST